MFLHATQRFLQQRYCSPMTNCRYHRCVGGVCFPCIPLEDTIFPCGILCKYRHSVLAKELADLHLLTEMGCGSRCSTALVQVGRCVVCRYSCTPFLTPSQDTRSPDQPQELCQHDKYTCLETHMPRDYSLLSRVCGISNQVKAAVKVTATAMVTAHSCDDSVTPSPWKPSTAVGVSCYAHICSYFAASLSILFLLRMQESCSYCGSQQAAGIDILPRVTAWWC